MRHSIWNIWGSIFLSANQTLRQRTTEAVMRLLSGQKEDAELDAETASMLVDHGNQQIFNPQERRMIERHPLSMQSLMRKGYYGN